MKRALLCWLAAGCLPAMAGLTFDQPSQKVKVKEDTESTTFDFTFTNSGSTPVTIAQVDGGCQCLGSAMQGGKLYYQPGEKGTLRTTFDLEAFSGLTSKVVNVWLEGDKPDKPSYTLKLEVDIPAQVEVSPRTLTWTAGEAAEPKTVAITVTGDDPIRVNRVSNGEGKFRTELKTLEEGRKYELAVTPVSAGEPAATTLKIETDSVAKKSKVLMVFALVQKPGAKVILKPN